MTLAANIISVVQAIGADIKSLKATDGALSSLNTTAKGNLVAAINELQSAISNAAGINDTASSASTTTTYSANKITALIESAKTAVKNDLVSGAAAALDTLNELSAALDNDPNFATTMATSLSNRVRYDAAQTLTSPQQIQARSNIGAAEAAVLSTLSADIGDTASDFVAAYTTAKT